MSSNLDFGLFDRSIRHFSSARRTLAFINPQDFDHIFAVGNLANNRLFVNEIPVRLNLNWQNSS